MIRTIYIFLTLILLQSMAVAQVGINTPNPDSTAILDVYSTSRGFLIPRMSSSQRNAMSTNGNTPAHSLLVFDTDLNKYFYYDNSVNSWLILNPWYAKADNKISYGIENNDYRINISPTGGSKAFKVFSSYNGVNEDSMKFQSEFSFEDASILHSGIMFNSKIASGNFNLMKIYYNNHAILTLKSDGKLGLGYTSPSKELDVRGEVMASGEVSANKFVGKGTIPIGGIIIWTRGTNNFPSGWALCDGNNGTPDLRDKFIVGGGGTYSMNSTGGEKEHALTIAEMPAHHHTGITSTDGSHRHFIAKHSEDNTSGSNSIAYYSNHGNDIEYKLQGHSGTANTWDTSSDGAHSHTLTVYRTGGGSSHENRPPYYALVYIIRIN